MQAIIKGNREADFVIHCIDNGHTFSVDNIHFLHQVKKGANLDLLEKLQIKKGVRSGELVTNEQTTFSNLTLIIPLSKL